MKLFRQLKKRTLHAKMDWLLSIHYRVCVTDSVAV